MNKYMKQVRGIVLENQSKFEKLGIKRDALKKSYYDGDLAKNDYESRVKEIEGNNNIMLDVRESINDIIEKYKADLNEWAILTANDLTDDIKLFNSPIEFTPEDYEELESKYQTNYSMLKSIKDHARKNKVDYSNYFSIDKEAKINSFNQFVSSAQGAIQATGVHSVSLTGALWDNEESFNGAYAVTSRFIQTNEGSKKLVSSDGTVSWG